MFGLTNFPKQAVRTVNTARDLASIALAATLTLTLAGCAASTPEPSLTDPPGGGLQPVSVALDWDANTNHLGIFVAESLGFFEEAGLEVTINPYAGVGVPEVVHGGDADFGVADQTAVHVERSAGADIVSVFRITQTETGRVIYLGDRADITRPADLDGLIFGGFDAPLYAGIASTVIRGDGGEGKLTEKTLNTSVYEGLHSGEIDFTLSVATWEDLRAELEGEPYGSFRYQDFGLPDVQTLGLISTDRYLNANPETSRAFLGAVQRGYEYSVQNPQEAAQLLIAANPDLLNGLEELVIASAELMANEYFVMPGRPIGAADPEIWESYGRFLLAEGFLVDADGSPLTSEPDWEEHYTEAYLNDR